MGCGASNDGGKKQGKYTQSDDEEERKSSHSMRSSSSSKKFTTEYASGSPRLARQKPAPQATASQEESFEEWNKKWKERFEQQEKKSQQEEVFVFGDFNVDKSDAQTQRLERLNRVRRKRKFSVGSAEPPQKKEGEVFALNDFVVSVSVDEGDDFALLPLEPQIPSGHARLQAYEMQHLLGHTARVKTIAVSPSEAEYASASMEDNTMTVYDISTGEEGTAFDGHSAAVISATFSKDGRYMATSSRDNTVIIWDMAHRDTAKRQMRLLDHSSLPICCTFSNDASNLISGCQDRSCLVWHVDKGELMLSFEEHEGVIVCVAAVPDMDAAISGGGDRVIRMWNTETGEQIRKFIGHDGVVISLNFAPDGQKFLSNDDRACKMWVVETGACVLNVTLESLVTKLSVNNPPPMPLSKEWYSKRPAAARAKEYGLAPNGIMGPSATTACRIGVNRSVFTLSCFAPGLLGNCYFAVASTNKMVYIVNNVTGREEVSFQAKAAVFAIAGGRVDKLLFGDIFGNLYVVTLRGKEQK